MAFAGCWSNMLGQPQHLPKILARRCSDYQICPIGVVLGELKAGRAAKARLVSKTGFPAHCLGRDVNGRQ
jgi:hypothetical protein